MIQKLSSLAAHIKNTGLKTFVYTKWYDYGIRIKLYAAGVDFSKTKAQLAQAAATSLNNDAHENQASSFYTLKKSLGVLPLKAAAISLLDIGCGSGRVINYCMLRKTKAVTGIDLDDEALRLANANCHKLFQHGYTTPFMAMKTDATKFDIPAGVNAIYLFNPFGRQTMQATAANIIKYVQKTKVAVYVIYCMPSFKEVFENEAACIKVYEEMNRNKSRVELAVYKISPVETTIFV